ncbi:MAG: 4Fe-4S dicluster domain-containing protein [Rikenellaceae bacterium]|nr:4Fe-4S dicluster domain-containing protein [Rikenellaceae bacterium]
MAIKNNVMIVRQRLLTKLVSLWNEGQLVEKIDRVPIEFSPRNSQVRGRCCIHKERAVWKYKSLPLLGYDMTDEADELTPLSDYAKGALDRKKIKDNIMCVIDEACSSCVRTNYDITNLCRGCVARACEHACPKGAIEFDPETSQGKINHKICISCGKCFAACPYHAIVYIPVPCEEACPVGAISKDEYGVEHIDESKCIYCGKCMNACPFGAIFEISQVFDILQAIRRGEEVVAMVAPSILSQYDMPTEQVYGAIKAIGFKDVIEVARGAEVTTEKETHEFAEKMEEGQPFMTTSCCPSYMEMARKHAPELQKYISSTYSPMIYTADIAREKYPNAKLVFVGPCIAKRKEVRREGLEGKVDFVLTYEEIHAILSGMGIEIGEAHVMPVECASRRSAHGFAENGGVTAAVQEFVNGKIDFTTLQIAGLNKKNVALLKAYGKSGKAPAQFIEVMVCDGGCISGPSVHTAYDTGKKTFASELNKR